MGSWDCLCAFCGCPLSRSLIYFCPDILDPQADGYNPEVVKEDDARWIGDCRCIGINMKIKGGPKAYLSRKGSYDDYGVFEITNKHVVLPDDPNDPLEGGLNAFRIFDEYEGAAKVFPFHEVCYEILGLALHNNRDTTCIDKDVLYTIMDDPDRANALGIDLNLDYGRHEVDQFWHCVVGEDHIVCYPGPDPNISAHVHSTLPAQVFISNISTAPNLASKVIKDPFSTLPYDILHHLTSHLSTGEIFAFTTASYHSRTQTLNSTFWKSMIKTRILPWFFELGDLCTNTLFHSTDLDFKQLFLWLDRVTKPEFGMRGPFIGIANRRRILHAVDELVLPYHEARERIRKEEEASVELLVHSPTDYFLSLVAATIEGPE